MANYIVVHYFFKVLLRHWSVFCHYLDPLDRLSLKNSPKIIISNTKTSHLETATTTSTEVSKNKNNKENSQKIKTNSIKPLNEQPENSPTGKSNNNTIKCWDFTFLYPILHMAFCALFGNVYLVYAALKEEEEKTGNTNAHTELTLESFLASPYSLFHQVFPRLMWPQSDVCDGIGILGAVAIYASFLRNPVKSRSKYASVVGKGNGTLLAIGQNGKNI